MLLLCLDSGGRSAAGRLRCDGPSCSARDRFPRRRAFPLSGRRPRPRPTFIARGFVNKQLLPNANFVAGRPGHSQHHQICEPVISFTCGPGLPDGAAIYEIVRELVDANRYEMFAGQQAMLKAMGQPYAELGRVRIVDTRSKIGHRVDRVQLRDRLIRAIS